MKMPKDSPENVIKMIKKKHKEKLMKDIKVFLKKKNFKKSNNMVIWWKIYQRMRKESLLGTEKNIINWQKTLYYNKNLFSKSTIILKMNDLESSLDEEYVKAK